MNPCKHLDFDEATYGDTCTLKTLEGFACPVKYWERGPVWLAEDNPKNVQFCGLGRGRINSIFACYNGEFSCYEPQPADGEANAHPS